MKERFVNIFDMNKKRKGIAALCAIVILIGIAGASVVYGVDYSIEGEKIDNISLLNAGNTFDLVDGKFLISYGTEKSVVVPLTPDTDDKSAYFKDKAIYISDEVTAVAYGGHNNNYSGKAPPVSVLISGDKGQTWRSYTVTDTKTVHYEAKYIGFTTKDDGWLLLSGSVAMGHQENRIFQTSDGGKNWREIGNTSDTYARVATGAGFADKNIGFVSFRYDLDINPVVYRTQDKGRTWTKCSLEIPSSYKGIATYATARSPVFNGANGVLPVTFRNSGFDSSGNPVDVTVRYETSDYGKTWTFNEKYNLALIWAEAWSTRDGRAWYQIMDSKMQSDFRSQQEKLNGDSNNLIIRWSSPWVVKYDVMLDGDQAVVTYWYTDSTTNTYKGIERLSFGSENGRTVVTGCKTEVDIEEYVDTSGWKSVDTGLYRFSIPGAWEAKAYANGMVRLFAQSGEKLGTLSTLGYDPSRPISQFEGNHAETLSSKTLDGCKYPATKVIIRRTQPAAANDDSYVDELHIYLIPKGSRIVYDLCFDSALINQNADEIAKSMLINTDRVQIQMVANQWAKAVQNRDGKAQYGLMSPEFQKRAYNDYQESHWVTGLSSPWVDSYRVAPSDDTAVVTYTYMTSAGFAGYYEQTLSFTEKNGHLVISGVTKPEQPGGQSEGVVISYLENQKTYLSADRLKDGMFSDMMLSIDGKTKRFTWKTYSEIAFLPELSYADLDADGRNELIIILCENEGTGVLVEKIHILNPEDFSGITVQSPLTALQNRVKSKIDESGVIITIDNQHPLEFAEKEIDAKVAEKEHWFGNLATGAVIDYSMQGNDIVVRVAAQLSPAGLLGDFNLKYEYKDQQFKVSSISFAEGYEK